MKTTISQPFEPFDSVIWEVKAKEPDGWEKAWEVTKNGEHKAYFRYKDSAEYYVNEQVNKSLLRG